MSNTDKLFVAILIAGVFLIALGLAILKFTLPLLSAIHFMLLIGVLAGIGIGAAGISVIFEGIRDRNTGELKTFADRHIHNTRMRST